MDTYRHRLVLERFLEEYAVDQRDVRAAMDSLHPIYAGLAEGSYPLPDARAVDIDAVRTVCYDTMGVMPARVTMISHAALTDPRRKLIPDADWLIGAVIDPAQEIGVRTGDLLHSAFGGLTDVLRRREAHRSWSLHAEFVPLFDGQFARLLEGRVCGCTGDAIGDAIVKIHYFALAAVLADDRMAIPYTRQLTTLRGVPLGIRKGTRDELLHLVA